MNPNFYVLPKFYPNHYLHYCNLTLIKMAYFLWNFVASFGAKTYKTFYPQHPFLTAIQVLDRRTTFKKNEKLLKEIRGEVRLRTSAGTPQEHLFLKAQLVVCICETKNTKRSRVIGTFSYLPKVLLTIQFPELQFVESQIFRLVFDWLF